MTDHAPGRAAETPSEISSPDGARPGASADDYEPVTPTHYVGIGTSAGGLEALGALFANLPSDLGVAYVVVQHLSPDFKSMMAELLQRSTSMHVETVTDGALAHANTVYMIPPGKTMTIADGHLRLVDQERDEGIELPIDHFLRSLGQDQPHRGIAIILTGTGSDGSRGLRTVKEGGGLIIVQDPGTAKFNGMPYAAVNTGLADLVLPVEEIASSLASYVRHPIVTAEDDVLDERIRTRDGAMRSVFELLLEQSGIDFSQYKPSTVSRRIQQRMGIRQVEDLEEYRSLLLSDDSELSTLGRELLIGVTRFFRDEEAFTEIAERILPEMVRREPTREPIRIWSVGCSTGEEAYSLAILFREALSNAGINRPLKIFGTDVDADAIQKASLGVYPDSIQEDVSAERLERFFDQAPGGGYQISQQLRSDVVFAVHNVLSDPPFSNIDLCSCRNMLIYVQQPAQRRALQTLHFALRHQGVLFLGSSESIGDIGNHFATLSNRQKLFRKASHVRLTNGGTYVAGVKNRGDESGIPSVGRLMRSRREVPESFDTYRRAIEGLVDRYVPPSVVINERHEILHVYGDIDRYTTLRPGQFRPTLENLIHRDLSVALSTALVRAGESEEEVLYTGVTMTVGERTSSVDMWISPVPRVGEDDEMLFLVTFEVDDEVERAATGIAFDEQKMSAQRIADLEEDLRRNQSHLQVTVEELESTNEELQTSNEELMASNEELQSTNEELQSVNEELFTVNSEFQEKVAELNDRNSDLNNTFDAIDVGIVFLEGGGLITNFTPGAMRHINIDQADIGRPFRHLSHDLIYPDLHVDIATVMTGGDPIEREVTTEHGEVILAKLQPYVRDRDTRDGVVFSVTRLRNSSHRETELMRAYHQLRGTVGQALFRQERRHQVLVVDDNPADRRLFRDLLQTDDEEATSFEVHDAADAAQAIQILQDHEIDVALLDQQLGSGPSGIELIEQIRQLGFECPFVMVSGFPDSDVAGEALELGVFDFIDKSALNTELLQRCIVYAIRDGRTERYLADVGWEAAASD